VKRGKVDEVLVDDSPARALNDFHKLMTAFMLETICTMSYFNRQGKPMKPIITGGLWIYQGEVEDDFEEDWFLFVCRKHNLDPAEVAGWIRQNKVSAHSFQRLFDTEDPHGKWWQNHKARRRACST